MNSTFCLLHSESMCMNSAVTIHTCWGKKKPQKKANVKEKREFKHSLWVCLD